ncbi:MAG: PilZ domain-containing protein [Lachnospiraceae bacterium]|nr:PilZ domain-containing protein [Lachnospiraceae bacterium]
MEEKRKSKRLPISLELNVSSVFKQDNVKVGVTDAPVIVTDISKGGIGFESESILPVGYYFNARLEIGSKEAVLYTVVKIIRSYEGENGKTMYGCEFVGFAPVLEYIFDDYEAELK